MELSSKPPILQYRKRIIHSHNHLLGHKELHLLFVHTTQELWNNILIPPTPNTHMHTCVHCLLFVKLYFERVSHLISQVGPEHVIFLSQPSNQMVFQLCLTLSGCGLLCGREGISCLVVNKCSRKQKQMLMIKVDFIHSFRNVCWTLTMSRYHSRCWR